MMPVVSLAGVKGPLYGSKTTTKTKRNHLATNHGDTWIKACDDLKIVVHLTGFATEVLRDYRTRNGQEVGETLDRVSFTNRAFVDLLMEFIITEDMVCSASAIPESFGNLNFCFTGVYNR
jgi:hypothetical protein